MVRGMLTVLVSGLWTACGAALPAVPGQGGPPWVELTSEHVTLWTDAGPASGRELIRAIEHLRQVVAGVAFPDVPAGGHSLVIALRDDAELSALSPTGEPRAFAVPASPPLWQPMIVLSAFTNSSRAELTVAHELTHLVSFAAIHHQPRWLAEGIAQFFETVRLDPDSTAVDVGVAPENRGQPARIAHLVPISSLLTWQSLGSAADERGRYSTSWALFTFLINQRPSELARYLTLLDASDSAASPASRADQHERAWRTVFPMPDTELDGQLRQWLVSGHHIVLHVRVRVRDWPTSQRALSDADVYALRALLHATPTAANQQQAELAAALAAEPTHVLATLIGVSRGRAVTPDEARAITAAHGDDWRAWWLAEMALAKPPADPSERDAARAKTCELIAQNPALVPPPSLCPGS